MAGGPDACPEFFLKNAHRQGTFVDCAGNSLEDLLKNLAAKHAAQHHSSPDHGVHPGVVCQGWCVLAMVSGSVALVGAVMYQLCESALRPFRVSWNLNTGRRGNWVSGCRC